jgi:hypothetical protein
MGEIWQATNSAAFAERELRIAAGTASSTVRVAAPAQLSGRVGRAISQTTSTPLLNLNFGWGTEKTGTAAIGQTTNDFWNWCNTWWGTPFYMTDLAWSDGSDSGASLEIDNGTGLWGSGSPDPMYDSFVYSG